MHVGDSCKPFCDLHWLQCAWCACSLRHTLHVALESILLTVDATQFALTRTTGSMLVEWTQLLTGKIIIWQMMPLDMLLIKPSVVTVSNYALLLAE